MGDREVLCRFWAEVQNINGNLLRSLGERALQIAGAECAKFKLLGKGVEIDAFIQQIFHFKPHVCLVVFCKVCSGRIHQQM